MNWLPILNANPHLSDRYRQRYAILLRQLVDATEEQRTEAVRVAASHASRAVGILLGVEPVTSAAGPTWQVVVEGSARPPADRDLGRVMADLPSLEQTRVPLHPSRHAHVLPNGVIALRWSAATVGPRTDNAGRFAEIAQLASERTPLPVRVWDDYTICSAEQEHVWVLSPNLGITLEDRLRDDTIARKPVVETLRILRSTMLEHGLIWQGFAPRNMFMVDGQLLLIDFEEVVNAETDSLRAAECLLWHQMFFADCLDDDERVAVFNGDGVDAPAETAMPANDFERVLLGVDVITFAQRRALILAGAALGSQHRRLDGRPLFGHELGLFWGDYVPVEIQASIFRALAGVADRREKAACLEAFEAAMEADIIRSLRQHAMGDTAVAAPTTAALAEVLAKSGTPQLAAARHSIHDWYNQLASDPAILVDSVVFQLISGGRAEGTLIGSAGTRGDTEVALSGVRAVGIGLDSGTVASTMRQCSG